MSDKIEKIKPDKVRKRTIASLEERKGYAEMIKYENIAHYSAKGINFQF
jgi:hypothetical protein